MPFVWSIGTIVGPAIGGILANPAVSYPRHFSPTGIFGVYPYLLPNLVCALLLLVGIVVGYFLLEETHPGYQRLPDEAEDVVPHAEAPLIITGGAMENPTADLRADSYGTFNPVDITEEEVWRLNADGTERKPAQPTAESETPKTFTRRVIMLVLSLSIFTYHSMTYDHLLPIFLEDDNLQDTAAGSGMLRVPGGLGLSTKTVGLVLSVNGITAIFIQAIIFPILAERLGVYRLFIVNMVLQPIAYFMVPFLAFLPESILFPGIYTSLFIRNLFAILSYPIILILLKEAAPHPLVLGRINGLAASAGAATRTIAPPIAGYLYSVGARHGFTGLAWWGSGLVAIIGGIQCFFVERDRQKTAHVHSVAEALTGEHHHKGPEVVHITVDSCSSSDTEQEV